ncbi:hypothetical protein LIPSTDRAFT_230346 [Lipomyces starkeyi NRRL Y-11557]|uniref:Uncharacterized protein n=1 Tax=Lipomyces starkeyi NRRL Y-11557 TaxID=675824 RepID=A0A1E3QB27_LIPST|nr:hypothetical protein LIPSTDRAFT_230346 [Lipomyces starkeyi NRRL Y-11557]
MFSVCTHIIVIWSDHVQNTRGHISSIGRFASVAACAGQLRSFARSALLAVLFIWLDTIHVSVVSVVAYGRCMDRLSHTEATSMDRPLSEGTRAVQTLSFRTHNYESALVEYIQSSI